MAAIGYEHRCINENTPGSGLMHTRGAGKGPSKCRYCGSAVMNMPGMHGVFVWRGDGNYRAADAISLHASAVVANRKALAGGMNLVVRFISDSSLLPSLP